MKKFLLLTFIPAILWVMIITGFSGESGEKSSSLSLRVTKEIVSIIDYNNNMSDEEFNNLVDKLHTPVRKLAHFTEYAILFVLIYVPMILNFKNKDQKIFNKLWIVSFVLCVLCAASDEIHQLFVQDREGKFIDVCIDSSGAFICGMIFAGIHKITNTKKVRKCKQ